MAYALESEGIPELTLLPALVLALGPPAIEELFRLTSLHMLEVKQSGSHKSAAFIHRVRDALSHLPSDWQIEHTYSERTNQDTRQMARELLDHIRVFAPPPQRSEENKKQQVHRELQTEFNSQHTEAQSRSPLSRTRRMLLGEWVRRRSGEPLIFMSNDTLMRGTVFLGSVRIKTTNEIEVENAGGHVIERWVITKLTIDRLILKDCEHTHTCYYRSLAISES